MTDSQKRLRDAARKLGNIAGTGWHVKPHRPKQLYSIFPCGEDYGVAYFDDPDCAAFCALANPEAILEILAALERAEVDAALVLSAPTADTVNAGRYLYLRDCCNDNPAGPIVCQGTDDDFEFLRGAELDAAIDAARKD